MIRPKEDAFAELLECRGRRRRAYVNWSQGIGDGRTNRSTLTRAAVRECQIEQELGLIPATDAEYASRWLRRVARGATP